MLPVRTRTDPRSTRARTHAAALLLVAATLTACTDSPTAPEALSPADAPSLAAGGMGVASFTPLMGLPDATYAFAVATDVNDFGTIVGYSSSATSYRAVLWNGTALPTALPDLVYGQYSQAVAISQDGSTIVGTASDGTNYVPVRWIRIGTYWAVNALDLPGIGTTCYADDVSSDGSIIVGRCFGSGGYVYAYAWKNGYPQFISGGTPSGVNDAGVIVGQSSAQVAMRWDLNQNYLSLGTLGGLTSNAVAIDAKGNIAGDSDLPNNAGRHPFLWTERKGMVDLGSPGVYSGVSDMNESLQIVGYTYYATGASHGTLWSKGKALDIAPPPGYDGSSATGINNAGTIVGWVSASGTYQAATWQLR